MWGRHRKLARLGEELATIEVFDRVHDYNRGPNRDVDAAYVSRRTRRAEILAEIADLQAKESWLKADAATASVILALGATAYATFHLLK